MGNTDHQLPGKDGKNYQKKIRQKEQTKTGAKTEQGSKLQVSCAVQRS